MNDMLRKQQLTFMVSNFIAFTLIFMIFGLIIFSIVQSTLYSQADKELQAFQEKLESNFPDRIPKRDSPDDMPFLKGKQPMNPRIIALKWNDKGKIINQEQMGSLFYETYSEDISFDKSKLDVLTNISIDDSYNYRSLLFKNKNETNTYTQLLINVDSENSIIRNFEKILIICSMVAVLLSITASFILSRKSMKPIVNSWNRQLVFVENASHELRTPLTIIQNKLELLLTTPNEKIVDKFDNIALSLSETRRLSKLTTDLLTLARADSSETQIVKEKLDLDMFIKDVCTPYIEVAELQNKHLQIDLQSNVEISADKSRIHQLIIILLDNALKYTAENDTISIKTTAEEAKVMIQVSDTGMGISEEHRKHIFDRFYRADQARSREHGGVGLGLSIAQWIVGSHQGTIKVESTLEKGTTFTIKLPRF
ncbi:sensor histidine kinase [Bacillus massiliigorillae]|uniref:sensor histidine kinase n=1 Tax=Bacillus massiliigorillae TaxID=1243664 RepID=UPI00039AEE88|nr:ATP-binding protein [Bacillus massiliigorillae]